MEDLKKEILALLGQSDYTPLDLAGLQKHFHQENSIAFMKILVALEEEQQIMRSSTNKYHLPSHLSVFKGQVAMHKKGFAFVKLLENDEEVYVSQDHTNGAYHDDIVMVKIISESSGDNSEGEIVKIVERGMKRAVGLFCRQGKKLYVSSDDAKYPKRIDIDENHTLGAMPGHKVVVDITDYQPRVKGVVAKIIGHKNDPGVDILSLIERYDVDVEFNQNVYQEIEDMPDVILEHELVGRRDFRNWQIATIDGDDAKDLDDAISIRKDEKGHYHLGVHIADVSHYVQEGTALDREAVARGTSIYLVDRVIPMLPHKLSNGICSLNPLVDRLTVSCLMEIDAKGNVVNHEIVPSVINSKHRMTYREANQVLSRGKFPQSYAPFIDFLDTANELAHILRKKRDVRGAIDFDAKETKIVLDEKGKVADIVLRQRGEAERLIEEMMLVANETVAEHMRWLELPYIYRVHEKPLLKKLQKLMTTLGPLGYHLHGSLVDIHPNALASLLAQSEDTPEHSLVSTMTLRCMQKAKYSHECLGHFGLADEYYTHFTSPIRRYPDLLGHRLLHLFLFEGKTSADIVDKYEQKVPVLAESSSNAEMIAVDLERDVDDMKKAEYMASHIGETFEGIISSVTRFGFFVELENTVEGLVHISELKDDYYHFDEFKNRLVGERGNQSYGLLEPVKIKVVNVNKVEGTIDFGVVSSSKPREKKVKKVQNRHDNPFDKYYNRDRKNNRPKGQHRSQNRNKLRQSKKR